MDPHDEDPEPTRQEAHLGEATVLLRRLCEGEEAAASELLPLVYDELHRLARRAMAGQAEGHTLQATALLNEAWLRMRPGEGSEWNGREHFLAVAARAMRSILVDRARKRSTLKRDAGGERIELDHAVDLLEQRSTDLCQLDEALEELGRLDERSARVVEMRFFAGLGHPEIARLLDTPLRTIERDWATARTWLHKRLKED